MWRTMPGSYPLEDEYKKATGITPEDVKGLRQWLQSQPHLPAEHITDLDLILAYHCCDRSTTVSKQVLDLNLTLRTMFDRYFKNRVVDDKILSTYHKLLPCPLEIRGKDDCVIFYARLLDNDAKNFNFAECVRAFLLVIDIWQYKTGTWPGIVIVIDLDKLTLGHVGKLDLQTTQQFLYYLQEAMLVKIKGLHYINAPSFMDKIMMLLNPFMKKSLKEVLFVHQTGSKSLEEHMPISGLPKEAGGNYKSFNECRDDIIALVKSNMDYIEAENNKRVVEARRPGKAKTISDIFGSVEGSFKKLDID